MNLKLSAFFLASGVMLTHGQYAPCDGTCSAYIGMSLNAAVCYDGWCDISGIDIPSVPCTQPTQLEPDDWCNDSDDWKWRFSPGNPVPDGYTRRKLDESDVLASLSSSCVDTFYKISIKTIGEYGHIGVLAEPTCKEADNIKECGDCPSYVFHANLDAEHPDMLQKIVEEVVLFDDEENYKHDIHHEIEHLYELHELLDAYKDVELDDNESYNLMHNNCGTFLIEMAHNLGIDPTDPDIINSVADMLSTTTKVGSVIGGSKYMARFIKYYVHAN